MPFYDRFVEIFQTYYNHNGYGNFKLYDIFNPTIRMNIHHSYLIKYTEMLLVTWVTILRDIDGVSFYKYNVGRRQAVGLHKCETINVIYNITLNYDIPRTHDNHMLTLQIKRSLTYNCCIINSFVLLVNMIYFINNKLVVR